MNSKDKLIKLLQENEDAREKFQKLGSVPKEEAEKEFMKFGKEFGIEIRKEDFAGQELDNEQLGDVTGGGETGPLDWIELGLGIYEFISRPEDTRRGTVRGSKRYKR